MTEVLRAGGLRDGVLMLDQKFFFGLFVCFVCVVTLGSVTAESRRTD